MKQTISTNQFDGSQPNSTHMGTNDALILKSNVPQQIHIRQSSVNVDGSTHNKKMSVQHRKNKSMLNN